MAKILTFFGGLAGVNIEWPIKMLITILRTIAILREEIFVIGTGSLVVRDKGLYWSKWKAVVFMIRQPIDKVLHGQYPNLYDYWTDTSINLLQL